MKYISEDDLRKHIIKDNCDDGCGYIDERDMDSMEWVDDEKFIPISVITEFKSLIRSIEYKTNDDHASGSCMFSADYIEELIDHCVQKEMGGK